MTFIVGTVILAAMPVAFVVVYDRINSDIWEVSSLDRQLILETEGGTFAWYESGTFGTVFELVSEEGNAIPLTQDEEDSRDVGGRTFAQFAETELAAGTYELRFTPSPFANDDALVAYGESPEVIAQHRQAVIVAGILVALILAYAFHWALNRWFIR